MPADLLVRDAEQQTAILNRVVLLDVPFDRVTALLEQQRQQQRQQQEQMQRQREEAMRAQQGAGGRGNAGEDDSKSRRIAELERRIIELEAQNKLLRDLIGQSSGRSQPATAP